MIFESRSRGHIRLVAIATLLALVTVAWTHVPAQADPAVSLSPTSGGPYDTFVFTGSGFATGAVLRATYTDPSGAKGTITDSYGADAAIKVANDGTWELRLQPGSAFRNAAPGAYQLTFCLSDGGACWSSDLKIANDSGGGAGGGMGGGY